MHGEMCATARTHLLGEKRATARTHLLGEKRATARTHLLGEKRVTARPLLLQWSGECEGGYCRDSSPFTSFSPPFGKLTTKFELLCKETQSPQFQSFGGETSECGWCGDGRSASARDSADSAVRGGFGRRAHGQCVRGAQVLQRGE